LVSLLAEQLSIGRKTKKIPLFRSYAIPDRFLETSGKEGYIQDSMISIELHGCPNVR
jgi:hypothetical protein